MSASPGRLAACVMAVAASMMALSGCNGGAQVAVKPAPAPGGAPAVTPRKHPFDLIGKVHGRGWYLPWYIRNPKNPNGPPIPVLIAEAETGEIAKGKYSPEFVMYHVSARLFQKGVHAANVQAGKIRANQHDGKVFASGGCTVKSLLNPADTVLTADRITWDLQNTRFIAEGHAHVSRRPSNGGVVITQEGGKIVYDLAQNTVTIL